MYYQNRTPDRNTATNHSNRRSHNSHTSSYSQVSQAPARPPSELLCDLHVYKVPLDLWRDTLNNIPNNEVTETVSVGIIRVPTETRLVDLREEIVQQLQSDDLVPRDYVFLRSVGRSLTRLRGKQEYQLKAKHFLPPVAFAPELYILEATPEIRDALAISDRSSQSPPLSRRTSPSHTHRVYPNTYRNGYPGQDSDPERNNKSPAHSSSSPTNKYKPLPQINSETYRSRDPYDNKNNESNRHNDPYNYKPNNDPYNRSNNDPYNRNTKNDPYNYRNDKDPYNYNNHHNDPQQDEHHQQQEQPPPEEYSEKPGSEWDEQPEDKHVVQVYHAAVHPDRDRTPSPDKRSHPRSADKGRDRRHDDDSGVAGLSPEDDYNRRNRERDDYDSPRKTQRRIESEGFTLDDETEADRRRRLEDLEHGSYLDRQRWEQEEEERKRQAEEDRRKMEEERRRKEDDLRREEEERRRREEEERRRKDEEDRRRNEEERERREEEERRERERQELEERNRQEEANRFASSPPGHSSSEQDYKERDTESARQRRRDEKNQLLKDLEDARRERQEQEKEREDLVKKAKQMQHKTTNRRNEARDMWKKKYFEEKKKTAPLEENSNRLRGELEALHKRLMNTLEGPKEKNLKVVETRPSEKSNYIIQCTKLQHEIEDCKRRVENARMKLTAEMKLRNQAQGELRALRAELTQRKTDLDNNRQQQLAALRAPPPQSMIFGGKENNPPPFSRMMPAHGASRASLEGF